KADIGHINLLPKGGRVEKVCTLKNRQPWLRKKTDLHLFDPYHGFTGEVMRSGQSILVRDIWKPGTETDPNPFLEVYATMNERYVKEIKAPLASIIIAPIKRGHDIFCTIELGRYREREPFDPEDKELIDAFGRQYGSLVIDYILDVKNRIAVNTAHRKLLALSRLIASNQPVDYRDAVEAYMKLSAADIGFAFFKTGELRASNYRTLVWQGEEIREVLLTDFLPSSGSMLRSDTEVSFLIEGEGGDDRLLNFKKRIRDFPGVKPKDRTFIQACLAEVRSYVAYPLHLLGQDLGAIVLGSRRERFW
ncbi:MAG: GAF domain-containing protein, partial [Thermodesulfobacteriota bacterium]